MGVGGGGGQERYVLAKRDEFSDPRLDVILVENRI